MKTPLLWTMLVLCSLSVSCNSYEEDDYANYHQVLEHLGDQYESLIQQYDFARFNFDQECIYDDEAAGRLIMSLLDSVSPFKTQIISNAISNDGLWYEVDFTVNGNPYLFRTETKTEWANEDSLVRVLRDIAHDLAPMDTFVFPTWNADQGLDVLYGNKSSFEAALQAGLPIDNPSIHWELESELVEGGIEYHLAVERPTDVVVKNLLIDGLAELQRLGYKVPQLNAKRVYVTDLFKDDQINLIINGDYLRSHAIKVKRKELVFSDLGYLPIVLWKLLQIRPNMQVKVSIEGGTEVKLSMQEFEERLFALLPRN